MHSTYRLSNIVFVTNSFPQMGLEEDTGGNSRQRHNRHGRDGGASAPGSLEKRIEDLERVNRLTLYQVILLVEPRPHKHNPNNIII